MGGYQSKKVEGCDWVCIDLELTGTNVYHSRIIEIAASRFNDVGISSLIRQEGDIPLSELTMKITGITDELLITQGIDEAEALRQFIRYIGENNVYLISHGNLDMAILAETFGRHKMVIPKNWRYIDSYLIAQYFDYPKKGLNAIAEMFGIINVQPHRALSDAQTLTKVIKAIMEQQSKSIDELYFLTMKYHMRDLKTDWINNGQFNPKELQVYGLNIPDIAN